MLPAKYKNIKCLAFYRTGNSYFAEITLYCFVISLLWGSTNPLIKKSTKGITKVKPNNLIYKFINEVGYLVVNWKYILLFLINQLGSVVYFILLQNVDLSLIVPTVNALTFIITGFVGSLIGEAAPSSRTFLGSILILSGITLCMFDKVYLLKSF